MCTQTAVELNSVVQLVYITTRALDTFHVVCTIHESYWYVPSLQFKYNHDSVLPSLGYQSQISAMQRLLPRELLGKCVGNTLCMVLTYYVIGAAR